MLPCQRALLSALLNLVILIRIWRNLKVVLFDIFLIIKDFDHLSEPQPFDFSLYRNICINLYVILKVGSFVLLIPSLLCFLYTLHINPLSDVYQVSLSPSVNCHFIWLIVSFALRKLFSFMRSHLLVVNLDAWSTVLYSDSIPIPMSFMLFPTYSSIRFSGLTLRYLTHLELRLCRMVNMDVLGFFYIQPLSLTTTICWRRCLVFQYGFLASLLNIRPLVSAFMFGYLTLFHWSTCLLSLPMLYCLISIGL